MPDPLASLVGREAVDHVLRTTRSVRRRLDFERPIERHVLEECIDLAAQAPTGLNREAWRFLVVTEPEPKMQLAEIYRSIFDRFAAEIGEEDGAEAARPGSDRPRPLRPAYRALADRLHELPALILVCSLGRPPADEPSTQVAFYGSVLPAAWSLMLALRARGLGTTWTTLMLVEGEATAELLGIPDDVTQTVLLPVAYTKDATLRPAQRNPAAEITFWNRWGQTD
jgi:nitroreductase